MSASGRPPRKRTIARELALQVLYQWDLLGPNFDPGAPLTDCCDYDMAPQCNDPEVTSFAHRLINGVRERKQQIDSAINETARNWKLSRMVVVDRTILRLGTWELGYCDDIPPRVSINEAIELAKKYSTDRSSAFVNGVLDRILRRFTEHPPTTEKADEADEADETEKTDEADEAIADNEDREPSAD